MRRLLSLRIQPPPARSFRPISSDPKWSREPEKFRMPMADGRLGHAEIVVGDSVIMLADEHPERGYLGPQARGGTAVSIMLYVEDVDTVARRFMQAGGKVLQEVKDQFYGDRSGTFEDPFGHQWTIGTHKEDLTPEEMERRAPKG